MRNSSDKSAEQNQNTILSLITFIFFLNRAVYEWNSVEKYRRAGQATDDNTAQAHCMLDN